MLEATGVRVQSAPSRASSRSPKPSPVARIHSLFSFSTKKQSFSVNVSLIVAISILLIITFVTALVSVTSVSLLYSLCSVYLIFNALVTVWLQFMLVDQSSQAASPSETVRPAAASELTPPRQTLPQKFLAKDLPPNTSASVTPQKSTPQRGSYVASKPSPIVSKEQRASASPPKAKAEPVKRAAPSALEAPKYAMNERQVLRASLSS